MRVIESFLTTRHFYRGITINVMHPHGGPLPGLKHDTAYGWCGYITLWLARVADEGLRESLWPEARSDGGGGIKYKYAPIPDWLHDLGFHGGVTYFRKLIAPDDSRGVKVGCDYRHADDYDAIYSLDSVLEDMRNVVDDLHRHTSYLMRCAGDGRLAPESEGTVPEGRTRWVSFEYLNTSRSHNPDGTRREEA